MILAKELAQITQLTSEDLTRLIREAGYKKDLFKGARFIGMTNGGQFCFDVDYDDFGELTRGKVFVKKNEYGSLQADY